MLMFSKNSAKVTNVIVESQDAHIRFENTAVLNRKKRESNIGKLNLFTLINNFVYTC